MKRFLFFLLFLPLAACQTPETDPADSTATPVTNVADPAADRAAIEAVSAAWQAAARAGDPDAIRALYTGDAIIHPANEPSVSGGEALAAYFAANYSEPVDLTLSTEDVVVAESVDMAYETGSSMAPTGAGKYLTVYRRTPEGWRIVADAWSDDAPPTPAN